MPISLESIIYLQNVQKAGIRIIPLATHGCKQNSYRILSSHVNGT